jgi:hypothetical protein
MSSVTSLATLVNQIQAAFQEQTRWYSSDSTIGGQTSDLQMINRNM